MNTLSRFKIYQYGLILSVSLLFSCSKTTDTPTPTFTVSTAAVTAIAQTTATTGGSITVTSGTLVITEKGVCYGTAANPTVSLSVVPISGSSLTAFTSNITGLTANTTYHVRAYVISESGVKYGSNVTFTTLTNTPTVVLPTVSTTSATAITQTAATTGGNITSNGNGTITASGVCYSTSQSPTTADLKVSSTAITGAFTSNITGLTPNTTYYVRAYATNSAGTAYGSEISFTTSPTVLATLTTSSVSSIMGTSATSGGTITSGGGAFVYARGVCWSTSANPTINDSKTTDGTDVGSFTSSITGLTPNTTYHVRAYATNNVGTAYGNNVTFTTPALAIGDAYQGGVVAYILQSGDAGYVSGQVHGLIAATSDQSNEIAWAVIGGNITGTSELLGFGNANTTLIVNHHQEGTGVYAAKLCYDLVLGGYSDWYLPSNDELMKLYQNKNLIGGFSTGKYWTSTQGVIDIYNVYPAMSLDFSTGILSPLYKSNTLSIRAIRSF